MKKSWLIQLSFICCLFGALGCSEPEEPKQTKDMGQDLSKDQSSLDMVDLTDMKDMKKDMTFNTEDRVPIVLDSYTQGNSGMVKAFESQRKEELIDGVVAHGLVGDYVLENKHVRFVVEKNDRGMSPCPYGGNVIDAKALDSGQDNDDMVGEVCLLLNVGQTLKPERYEILNDGKDGNAAVLAVTGPSALLDFLNFNEMAKGVAGGLELNLPVDINRVMPITITQYFILRPDDRSVRVVTAFRNNSKERQDFIVSHLISGGGSGGYFNPYNGLGGFGYISLGQDNLDGYLMPFLAYTGQDGTYAYVPKPDPAYKDNDLPISGSYITISGAAATVLGRDNVLKTILTPKNRLPTLYGAQHLEHGDIGTIEYQLFVGDGRLSSVLDHVYPQLGIDTGTVVGTVKDDKGSLTENITVTALDMKGRAKSQTTTGSGGQFEMTLPVGAYQLVARGIGQAPDTKGDVTVRAGAEETTELTLKGAGQISVTVLDPNGSAVPARVTVVCEGACPDKVSSNEKDVTTNRLPGSLVYAEPTGLDGKIELTLNPGTYRVMVSRGMEWSVWPEDATLSKGQLIEVKADTPVVLNAEIAHVVDSKGVLTGDFHIHSVPSPDSASSMEARVRSFLNEGVDVMVSTDHDIITDFEPTIIKLGATDLIKSIVGDEITTSDVGHINGFPVKLDDTKRRSGALDWGNGDDLSLTTDEIFKWIDDFEGEQVIQINHPYGTGTIGSLKVDLLRGISLAKSEGKRLPEFSVDPATGDTGLWSENFTAIEVMNGFGTSSFWTTMRWWFIMIGRGFSPTATAVTDTHQIYSTLGGSPRSFVFVPEGQDTIPTFNQASFVKAINEGRLIGSNGPFFRVSMTNDNDEKASLGDTLSTNGQQVNVVVDLEMPEWVEVDTIDVYMNVEGLDFTPAKEDGTPVPPTQSIPIVWEAEDEVIVAQGSSIHKLRKKSMSFTLNTSVDAYVVFVVHGQRSMFPVIGRADVKPLAFSNPIYLDADGGGYDKPHLLPLSKTPAPYNFDDISQSIKHPYRWPHTQDMQSGVSRGLTQHDIVEMLEKSSCQH